MVNLKRYTHSYRELETGSVLNSEANHPAEQLLWAGYNQAAEGVGQFTLQAFGSTSGRSDKTLIWYIRVAALRLTSVPKYGFKTHMFKWTQMTLYSADANSRQALVLTRNMKDCRHGL